MIKHAIPLLYHDVIAGDDADYSGFSGTDAAEYKLSVEEFTSHLHAINNAIKAPIESTLNLDEVSTITNRPVLITFDDGGVSSFEHIAPLLESFGWRGIFFITTDRIGTPAFMSTEQINDLHQRGHIIGSHSCSHPVKISDCSYEQLLNEWNNSIKILSEIIGEKVSIASIPGGFYSKKISEAASQCGIKQLFTSEPVQKIHRVDDCAVIGRFSISRGMGSNVPVDYVTSNPVRRVRQYLFWNLKKAAKVLAGPLYARLRFFLLARKK